MNGVKQDPTAADAKESTTIRFEWTLRNLKNLFENRLAPVLYMYVWVLGCH